MKKWIKLFGLIVCMIVSMTIFSACELGESVDEYDANAPIAVDIPSELRVSGYSNEIEVGDAFITKLKVEAKFDNSWKEVVKADYQYSCDYTGSKYGDYSFKVYMKEFPSVEFSDTISVKPKMINLPESYSTTYTGSLVDIKTHYEDLSNGLYDVQSYVNMVNCGTYSVTLKLKNTDIYVWCNDEGVQYKNPIQKVYWSITKAAPKDYTGIKSITAYEGDTLYDVMIDNNITNITWYRDGSNEPVSTSTKVTANAIYYAHYNENPENYENTLVPFTIVNFITVSNYTVEYYFYDGSEYVINEALTEILSGDIGELVTVVPDDHDGYIVNTSQSNLSGKILKQDGLILKVYYDLSN